MRQLAGAVAAVVLTAVTAAGQVDDGAFRSATRLVVLQATVTDTGGHAITDLTRDAFSVYENGKPQRIEVFRREDVPVSVGLVIDNSGSMRTLRPSVEASAIAFARASNPMDELCVVNFADKVALDIPFTSDVTVLEKTIARVDSIGGTALWDAIALAQSYVGDHGTRPRKVLLVITDGDDNASVSRSGAVVREAQRRDVVIDAIGLFGNDAKAAKGRHELDQLTHETGGRAYFPAEVGEVEKVMTDLALQIRNQYVIAYAPVNQALDGSYRTIRVTANDPRRGRLDVHTRAGYLASGA